MTKLSVKNARNSSVLIVSQNGMKINLVSSLSRVTNQNGHSKKEFKNVPNKQIKFYLILIFMPFILFFSPIICFTLGGFMVPVICFKQCVECSKNGPSFLIVFLLLSWLPFFIVSLTVGLVIGLILAPIILGIGLIPAEIFHIFVYQKTTHWLKQGSYTNKD
ncbi:UNKNOWN [Stylonychia lemnae]|uniref:Transmembrane protein n=1 Tax=Stylonychia lemnae TaxID=5949 RepID=A0A078B1J7_STYLE|nr:UNKNOWN [Stylonychia lemnae]|eukprot:CDW87133.1 UNKNOWN [Stylonychia lemnae]